MKKIIFGMVFAAGLIYASGIYATFSVKAAQSASLAFNASGIVEKVKADVGDRVSKGDTLATLKSDDLKAALEGTKVALKYAKKSYERMIRVKDVTDQGKLDAAAFKYENAKVQVAYKKALLDKTILKAPFDGVIAMRNIEVGDTLSGMRMVTAFRIQSLHARKLIVEFDQKYWHVVRSGLTFVYTVDGQKGEYKGKISRIYPAADPSNRKLKAEVPARDIPVGLFGEGKIIIPESSEQAEK